MKNDYSKCDCNWFRGIFDGVEFNLIINLKRAHTYVHILCTVYTVQKYLRDKWYWTMNFQCYSVVTCIVWCQSYSFDSTQINQREQLGNLAVLRKSQCFFHNFYPNQYSGYVYIVLCGRKVDDEQKCRCEYFKHFPFLRFDTKWSTNDGQCSWVRGIFFFVHRPHRLNYYYYRALLLWLTSVPIAHCPCPHR